MTYQSSALLRVVDLLFERPVISAPLAALDITQATARRCLERLVRELVLVEVTGRRSDRVYMAPEIIDIAQAPTLDHTVAPGG